MKSQIRKAAAVGRGVIAPAARQGGRFHLQRSEFVVIGLGRFGSSVAEELVAYGHDVLAIDQDVERVQHLSGTLPHVVAMDATNDEALRQVGAESFDTALVCIGMNFEANLLATVLLLRFGVRRVITKARTRTQLAILERVGAHEVILPEHEAGLRLARRLAHAHVLEYLELGPEMGIVEILAPPGLHGLTLAESSLRHRYRLTVVAVRRGEEMIMSPEAEFRIQDGDLLVVVGSLRDAERMQL